MKGIFNITTALSNFVILKTESTHSECTFLVDSGAEISVLKPTKLKQAIHVDNQQICTITGIQHQSIDTLGTINVPLHLPYESTISHKFHIIPENLPIPTDGILGRDFLTKFHCVIDYDTWTLSSFINSKFIEIPIQDKLLDEILIPPRCEVFRKISIQNPLQDYVILSKEIKPGVFCANSVLNAKNPLVKFINTTEYTVKIRENLIDRLQPLENYNIFSINQTTQPNRKENCISELNLKDTPSYVKDKLKDLCTKYNDIFALKNDILTSNNFYKQNINLNDPTPVYIKNYRTPEVHRTEIDKHIDQMLNEQIIQPSISPYNSPVLLVPKKSTDNDKKWRLAVDFRQLNKKVIADKFPLPRIDDILDQLGRAKYFTTLDLMSGFHQIELEKSAEDKYTDLIHRNKHNHIN